MIPDRKMKDKISKHLDKVSKPSRYIGNELGSIVKAESEVDLRFALVFPEVYEIGISNLGLRILYTILNSMPGVQTERVYSPWPDMESIMRRENISPYGLECVTPLQDFDIVGFSLQYELLYTNILNILELAGIPFYARARDEGFPLIIGGGPCAFNPEPVADFFDVFLIGDGERAVSEIVDCYRKWSEEGSKNKKNLLLALSEISGIYVPSFFEAVYSEDKTLKFVTPLSEKQQITKSVVSGIGYKSYEDTPFIPYCEAVHDRVNIEIMRGCSSGCRFCQAGIIYRPVREKSRNDVIKMAVNEIEKTGYSDLALCSLNVAGHSEIETIVSELADILRKKKVSLSLPSLRASILKSGTIAENIAKLRKTGFTIAPEAGSQRLRDIINKGISEEEIIDAAFTAFPKGWQSLKLYFMIGLPFEKDEDIREIAVLVEKIVKKIKQSGSRIKRISVSLSPFVPKAHTPFQWCAMDSREEIKRKIWIVLSLLKSRFINVEWHDPDTSILEGAFARGDRRMSDVIVSAFKRGAKFDGWHEYFNPEIWYESFKENGLTIEEFAEREREFDEVLPWEHIDSGVNKSFFIDEYQKAEKGIITEDCSLSGCKDCGLEKDCLDVKKKEGEINAIDKKFSPEIHFAGHEVSDEKSGRFFYRVKYRKKGLMKFLSHTEFRNLFERAVSRANIPVAFSEGFHPQPCVSYGMPLSVGIEGEGEYLDIELTREMTVQDIMAVLNSRLPVNVGISAVDKRIGKRPSLQSSIHNFIYSISFPQGYFKGKEALKDAIENQVSLFHKSDKFEVERKGKRGTIMMDLKKYVSVKRNELSSADKEIRYGVEINIMDGKAPSIYIVMKEIFGIGVDNEDVSLNEEMPCIVRERIEFKEAD